MEEKGNNKDLFSNTSQSAEEALQLGIDAIHRGDLKLGADILQWILEREPDNQVAWLWLACTVEDEVKRRECYIRSGSMR